MKVSELINLLSEMNQDAEVFLEDWSGIMKLEEFHIDTDQDKVYIDLTKI